MRRESDRDDGARGLTTPFREHLDRCRDLDLRQQLEECADYIQHVDLLVSEFLESYYLVERLWEPSASLSGAAGSSDPADGGDGGGELVLETFYESLELSLVDLGADPDEKEPETLVCLSGALSPLPADQHPALSRRGLDFVGLRGGEPDHIVLGVAQSSQDETPFLLLLRALNALAELSPPLRVLQLGREIIRARIPENADFSLQMGLMDFPTSGDTIALGELTRDLAEAVVLQLAEDRQLSGTLAEIACVAVDPAQMAEGRLERLWRVRPTPRK